MLSQIYSIDLLTPGSGVVDDFDKANRMLCALYSRWCNDNPKVIITSGTNPRGDRALVAKGGAKDDWKVCFRCWERGSHLSFECKKEPKICVRCGLDGGKGPSCGGEYDPVKCMVKGYQPPRRVSDTYMDKLRAAAEKIGVKFGVPDAEKGAEKTALVADAVADHSVATYQFVDGEFRVVPRK